MMAIQRVFLKTWWSPYLGEWRPFHDNYIYNFNPTFNCFGTGAAFASTDMSIMDIQPNNDYSRYYFGGGFTSFSGSSSYDSLLALNNQGILDTSFIPSLPSGQVNDIKVQPDGKVLIGGLFTSYSGVSRNRLARTNSDGTLDTTFNIGTGFNNNVQVLLVDSTGKILVGGRYTTFNGLNKGALVRLLPNGSIDTTFSGLTTGFSGGTGGAQSLVWELKEVGGKYYVAGNLGTYNGVACNDIVRLNNNGSLDTSFNATVFSGNSTINGFGIQSSGKLVVGGSFPDHIRRLNTDGSVDTTFTSASFQNDLTTIEIDNNDNIYVGGRFFAVNSNFSYGGFCKLTPNGVLDTTFMGQNMVFINQPFRGCTTIVFEPEQRTMIIGGQWTSIQGFSGLGYAKLRMDTGELLNCSEVPVSPTPTPSITASPTRTPTSTPTSTTTRTPTATQTSTPSTTPTINLSPTQTPSQTATPQVTPTVTPSVTQTQTSTPAVTETQTSTPTQTNTPSQTATESGGQLFVYARYINSSQEFGYVLNGGSYLGIGEPISQSCDYVATISGLQVGDTLIFQTIASCSINGDTADCPNSTTGCSYTHNFVGTTYIYITVDASNCC